MMALAWRTRSASARPMLQQVGRGADRRQRVAQLVRQHRQELVLALVIRLTAAIGASSSWLASLTTSSKAFSGGVSRMP
jgi:hypothetical protein